MLHSRVCACVVACIAMLMLPAAIAAPTDGLETTERPFGDTPKRAPPKPATYGLCDAPQNADSFPSKPVEVVQTQCEYTQRYAATSAKPSSGSSCGGFTIAFGQAGDLKPHLRDINMIADWGDAPLTQAQCAQARVAAVAWGARCTNEACTTAEWQQIGSPKQVTGTWNTVSKVCYIRPNFVSNNVKNKEVQFRTLNMDIIATLDEGGKTVRKHARGTIDVSLPNGKCPTASVQPRTN